MILGLLYFPQYACAKRAQSNHVNKYLHIFKPIRHHFWGVSHAKIA
jgi:hypothetical protein